jgi:hypothetical protein
MGGAAALREAARLVRHYEALTLAGVLPLAGVGCGFTTAMTSAGVHSETFHLIVALGLGGRRGANSVDEKNGCGSGKRGTRHCIDLHFFPPEAEKGRTGQNLHLCCSSPVVLLDQSSAAAHFLRSFTAASVRYVRPHFSVRYDLRHSVRPNNLM